MVRARYQYTISDKFGYVDSKTPFFDPKFMKEPLTWAQLRTESVVMPNFSYAELAIMVLKVCEKYPKECTEAGNPDQKVMAMAPAKLQQMIYLRASE